MLIEKSPISARTQHSGYGLQEAKGPAALGFGHQVAQHGLAYWRHHLSSNTSTSDPVV